MLNLSSYNETFRDQKVHLPLLQLSPENGYIYIILTSIALVSGVLGNAAVLSAYFTSKSLRIVGNELIINMVLADICVTAVADPLCIIAAIKGYAYFRTQPILCDIIAALCLTACFTAYLSITAITMERYIFVNYPHLHKKVYTRRTCILISIGCWLLGALFDLPNFLGWGNHSFDLENHSCIWDRTASRSYTIVLATVLFGGPMILMIACYVKIFSAIKKTRVQIKIQEPNPNIVIEFAKKGRETFKLCKSIFFIFMAFIILWLPYVTVIVADVDNTMPFQVHLWTTWLAHLHSAINWVILVLTHASFRSAIVVLANGIKSKLTCLLRVRRVTPELLNVPESSKAPTAEKKFSKLCNGRPRNSECRNPKRIEPNEKY